MNNPIWLYGPCWLSKDTIQTDTASYMCEREDSVPEECRCEMKVNNHHSLLMAASTTERNSPVLSCEVYSNLQHLFRVTALVMKFLTILKARKQGEGISGTLTATDVSEAEQYWIKVIQTSLSQNPKFSSRRHLGLYLDGSGLWRCGGRLNNTDLAECAKHPILHDASHHITKLIVHSCHKKAQHGGVRETLYHF